ncbi:MAG: DUF4342 domain-containing protein, partial [Peptostreptococcales bacterium]
MDISLDKIETIKDRTGVTYKEAKEALEIAQGDVVDAIIYIEEQIDTKKSINLNFANDLMDKLKAFVKKGNVSKIVFKKDNEVLLNIPVNAGIIGIVLSPALSIGGTFAALLTKVRIEIIKDDGEVIVFSDIANEKVDHIKSKADSIITDIKMKKHDIGEEVKEKTDDLMDDVIEKAEDVKEKITNIIDSKQDDSQ